MLSIIICSRKNNISSELKDNIELTIGVEYELIIIDNSHNKYSIFSAYNEGLSRAKYPYLCFMHEDILYQTKDWGEKVIAYFKDEKVGLIGVIGTHLISKNPCGWTDTGLTSGHNVSVNEYHCDLSRFGNKTYIEAIATDGLWQCVRRSLFDKIRYDDKTFDGFHCYDIDISLQVRSIQKQVLIVSDILINHNSNGNWGTAWVENTYKLHKKWENVLPQIAGVDISPEEIDIRTELAHNAFTWTVEYAKSRDELNRVLSSRAYKLGRLILTPFKIFKRKTLL